MTGPEIEIKDPFGGAAAEAAPKTVADVVGRRAGDPNVGLRFEGRTWTWAEVHDEMQRHADLLASLVEGVEHRHVGVLLDNGPTYLFLLGGAALAGVVLVGGNATRRGQELERDFAHTECAAIIAAPEHVALLEGLDLGPASNRVLVVGSDSFDSAIDGAPPRDAVAVAPDDLYLLIFTSGSTGAPKAVKMSHRRAAAAAVQMWFTPADVLYCVMPMFHSNALVSMVLPAIATGATLVMRPRYSASVFMEDVRAHGVTFFSTVGRALSWVLAQPPSPDDPDNQLGIVLAPESSHADAAAFGERFGCYVISGYGSSENAVIMAPNPELPPGALGVPMEGMDVAIVNPETLEECPPARTDANGQMLNADEAIGELVGRNTLDRFEGYWNNPEAEAARSRNGWYWTGDLAYRDGDGVFWFAGRTNDWLRVDGENFAAAPVERLLRRWEPVTDVVVVGVPDEVTVDDQVLAVLELVDPHMFDPADLDAFLDSQADLGSKWRPRWVRVLGALPLTPTNKVDRTRLRQEGWDVDAGVWWRPNRRGPLVPLESADRARIGRLIADR
ncbi:MAG: AMP-binding protein [Nitriliruptorales bacterium]|nr:AMP-binding protein [Nitriliruptorales bacterium]